MIHLIDNMPASQVGKALMIQFPPRPTQDRYVKAGAAVKRMWSERRKQWLDLSPPKDPGELILWKKRMVTRRLRAEMYGEDVSKYPARVRKRTTK